MKIVVTSVLVDDQDKALRFYTDVLGFEKKHDVPMGEFRWLTVVSPQDPTGTRAAPRAGRPPGGQAVQERPGRRWDPLHLVRCGRRQGRLREALRSRRALHPTADRDGSGDDGRLRRHVRQPHPDRPAGLTGPPARGRADSYGRRARMPRNNGISSSAWVAARRPRGRCAVGRSGISTIASTANPMAANPLTYAEIGRWNATVRASPIDFMGTVISPR